MPKCSDSPFGVQHQPQADRLILKALSADRLPHAFLFHGPDGIGKETFAYHLARRLLCSNAQTPGRKSDRDVPEACGECNDCRTCAADSHPDLHVVHRGLIRFHDDPVIRKRKGNDLGVDVVRQFVIDKVGAMPIRGRAKVFLVREADRITPQAQNALLKTLEEPPSTTFIILLVASLERILPTTRSRCHLTAFQTLPNVFVREQLLARMPEMTADRAGLIAALAQGSLGAALRHAEDGLDQFMERVADIFDAMPQETFATTTAAMVAVSEELGKLHSARDKDITPTEAMRRGLLDALALASRWYGDVLQIATGADDLVAAAAMRDRLRATADHTSAEQAADLIEGMSQCALELGQNVNVKLCLENLVIGRRVHH